MIPLRLPGQRGEWGEKGIGRRKKRGGERSKEGKEKEIEKEEGKGKERRKEETSSRPKYVLQMPVLSDLFLRANPLMNPSTC